MFSLQDPTFTTLAVEGVFDGVRTSSRPCPTTSSSAQKYKIGTVNSISWAPAGYRVVLLAGYFYATKSNAEKVSFTVPGFGNVCAGHVARMMVALSTNWWWPTNENNVLDGSSTPAPTVYADSLKRMRPRRLDGHFQGLELQALCV